MTSPPERAKDRSVPLLESVDWSECILAQSVLAAVDIPSEVAEANPLYTESYLGLSPDTLRIVRVFESDLARAVEALREAWGDEALVGRTPLT